MKLIWLFGIITFGGLWFWTRDVFMSALVFLPAFVIVLVIYLGAVQFANEVIKPIWKWLTK